MHAEMASASVKTPLASLGIISAASYQSRRDALRTTWLRWPDVRDGTLLASFIVLQALDMAGNDALKAEALTHKDLLLMPAPWRLTQVLAAGRNSSAKALTQRLRTTSPVVTTFAWLRFATSHAPFNQSSFVLKCDDDIYLVVPALVAQMRVLSRELSAARPHAYFGKFFWTVWNVSGHHHVGSSVDEHGVRRNPHVKRCMAQSECAGPYPYTTGSMQGLSFSLARALALAPAATSDVENITDSSGTPRQLAQTHALTSAKTPTLKRSWRLYGPAPAPIIP